MVYESKGNLRRRGAVLFIVLLGHALLASFLIVRERSERRLRPPLDEMTLVYLPPPRTTNSPQTPPERSAPISRTNGRNQANKSSLPPSGHTPSSQPSELPLLPPVDWKAEQEKVAESKGRDFWKQLSQRCRDAEALHIHPPECHRDVVPEPWEPEKGRFGFAGPLPYVRLGRCVLGLGFWGCAVGKGPPANSHVFDGIHDSDRRSSVPDNGSYQPRPESREPLH
jgi:hypothetical protein